MRTDLTAEIGDARVRGVVTVGALLEIADAWPEMDALARRLAVGDVRPVRAVLIACLKATGDLRPLEVTTEVDRLIETAGIEPCARFAERLLIDAFNKAETATRDFPQAGAATPD